MTIVSYSEVITYDQCPWKWGYRYGQGLVSLDESISITAGVAGHYMLEIAYKGIAVGKTIDEIKYEIRLWMSTHEKRYDSTLVAAYALVENYISELNIGAIENLIVETPFKYKVEGVENLTIGFTPDVAYTYHNSNRIIIEDYKFVGRRWSNKKLDMYRQLDVYTELLRRMGYDVIKAILRFFNVQTGEPMIREYRSSPERLQRTYTDLVKAAMKIQEVKEKSVVEQRDILDRTLNHYICQDCKYDFPCRLEMDGKDASKTLAIQYKGDSKYGYQ